MQIAELKEKLRKREDEIDRLYEELDKCRGNNDIGSDEDGGDAVVNGSDHSDTITIED